MILFFGYGDDRALELAADAARARGAEYLFVDQRTAADVECMLELGGSGVDGTLQVHGRALRLASVTGVYARPLSPVPTRDERLRERAHTLHLAMVSWLDVADARVVTRPSAMHSNTSKPFQAQEITAAGFAVPDTLVSSDPDEVRAFRHRHGEVVFKSISGIRSIVRRLDDARARDLDRIRALPTQFQALVPGVDVRVHVIGRRAFATEIRSDAVDYRYAGQDGLEANLAPVDLPDEVTARCVALAAALALPFCGIDLRRRPDHTFVCFEVNPMPGYSYYETHTRQPISHALVEHLVGAVS